MNGGDEKKKLACSTLGSRVRREWIGSLHMVVGSDDDVCCCVVVLLLMKIGLGITNRKRGGRQK